MSEVNKRHNRKIWKACPVCKGRVVLGYRNQNWWVYCECDTSHIPQRFFPHPHEAIEAWNVKGNKQTNADRIRAMTGEELADFINSVEAEAIKRAGRYLTKTEIERGKEQRLDWLREEVEENE